MAESPVPYSPTTALIVVDVQNDFADPGGSLYVTGGDQIVDLINTHIGQARAEGALVVFTQDWHPPETPHFTDFGGVWPVHCVRDTWGAELHPGLNADGPIIHKGTGGEDGYSGFSMRDPVTGEEAETELRAVLAEHGIEYVVVVGLALDVCVKATAEDAQRMGFATTVITEATRPVNLQPGDGDRAIESLTAAGVSMI